MTAIPAAFESPSFGKAWDLTVKHFATFLVLAIAVLLLGVISFGLIFVVILAFQAFFGGASADAAGTAILLGQLVGFLGATPLFLFSALLIVLLSAIPAVYFTSGEVVTVAGSFKLLMERPWRYLWAGIVFSVAATLGFALCYLPGLAVAFVGPVYINKIFTTNTGVFEALASSFSAVYKSEHRWFFIGIQLLVTLIASFANSCSGGLLGFLAIPASSFYIQNVSYRRGILS